MDSQNFVVELGPKLFTCVICCCDMTSYEEAYQHLYGRSHFTAVKKYGRGLSYESENTYYCCLCPCWILGYKNVSQHIKGIMHEALLEVSDSESSYDRSEEEKPDPYSFIIEYEDLEYHCILCAVYSYSKSFLNEHVATIEHTEAVQKYGYDIVVGCYGSCDCLLCECFISGYSNVHYHIMGNKHQTSLTQ